MDPVVGPVAKELGRVIRRRRRELDLSQADISTPLGRSQSWLSRIEAGLTEPSLDDLHALLQLLDMSLTVKANKETR